MKNKQGFSVVGGILALFVFLAMGMGAGEKENDDFSYTRRGPLGYYAMFQRIGDVLGAQPRVVRYSLSYELLKVMNVKEFGGKIGGEEEFRAYPDADRPTIQYMTTDRVALGDTVVEYWEHEDDTAATNANVAVFAHRFAPSDVDAQILNRFVERGGHAWVSAATFDRKFLDRFEISSALKDSFPHDPTLLYPAYSEARLETNAPAVRVPGSSSFFYFEPKSDSPIRVLGADERGKANFVVIPIGRGKLFLHSAPHAFANYYFLRQEGERYAAAALSAMPRAERLLWDDSHNHAYSDSILRVVMADGHLKTAWYLMLFGAATYLFFSARRVRRIIPVHARPRNTTVEFVETLGKLYYNRGDHANIARKRIEALYFFIRERYFLHAAQADHAFFTALTQKTGVGIEEISRLFGFIAQIKDRIWISREELARLNKLIEAFYAKIDTGK
jgi:hypothetical protein